MRPNWMSWRLPWPFSSILTGIETALERSWRAWRARGVLSSEVYLHLAGGEVVPGRAALQDALSGVSPEVATEVIALLDLLDRLEGETLAAFMRSAVLAHQGRTEGALSELEVAIDAAPQDERPPLLAMGARIADGGLVPERAARFRGRIIRDHPYSAEVPEATLELARFMRATPEGVDEAIRLLEKPHPKPAQQRDGTDGTPRVTADPRRGGIMRMVSGRVGPDVS